MEGGQLLMYMWEAALLGARLESPGAEGPTSRGSGRFSHEPPSSSAAGIAGVVPPSLC